MLKEKRKKEKETLLSVSKLWEGVDVLLSFDQLEHLKIFRCIVKIFKENKII